MATITLWTTIAALAMGLAWTLINILWDRVDTVRITEEGIEKNRRIHAWDRITSVGCSPHLKGVAIEFDSRTTGSQRLLRFVFPFPHTLATTPPLTRTESDKLIVVLREYLDRQHPHVVLNPEPRRSD